MNSNQVLKKNISTTMPTDDDICSETIKVSSVEFPKAIIGTTGEVTNITQQEQLHSPIQYLAHHDALTRLPNRLLLEQWSNKQIEIAKNDQQIQFFFIDLDNFKIINNTIGYSVGDYILVELAKRLQLFVAGRGFVSRIGGDEFIVCFNGADKSQLHELGDQLKAVMLEPILYNGLALVVQASIGASTFPHDGDDCCSLVKNADIAMYHAKQSGKSRVVNYTSPLVEISTNRKTVEKRIKSALIYDEFSIVYQPKIDLRTSKLIGFEALLRWQDSTTGNYYPPDEFIPIAESSDLILNIGHWVLEAVAKQIALWKTLPNVKPVAINISAQQIHQKNLAEQILSLLDKYQIPGELLELELTENVTMENSDLVIENLVKIRNAGIKISIDDFGTGYSNLAYLTKFPLDTLKIDRSFIQQIDLLPDKLKITRAIIDMGRSLELKVIAEGVETAGELQVMRDLNVDQVQGYYFDKPLSTEHAALKMRNNQRYEVLQ